MSLKVTLRVTYRGSGPRFFKVSQKAKKCPMVGEEEVGGGRMRV